MSTFRGFTKRYHLHIRCPENVRKFKDRVTWQIKDVRASVGAQC